MILKFILTLLLGSLIGLSAQTDSYRIMTYNIRYANDNPGEEWEKRKHSVSEVIRFYEPQIFGLQEALYEQVEFIADQFPNFTYVGGGRDDGMLEGEFCPIFISNNFKYVDHGLFWLSDTPDTPSIGWDAALNRIASWATVVQKSHADTLLIVNTHFDHIGEIARLNSTKLIIKKIPTISKKYPVLLMGDFNYNPTSDGYKYIKENDLLTDSWELSSFRSGPNYTFNGFGKPLQSYEKIDYIFVSKGISLIHHAVVEDKINNQFPSDHMPIILDFKIND